MVNQQVNAVLFDMDGLMIDSEKLYTLVTNEIIKPFGKEMTWEIKAGLMGRPALDAARYLIEATDLPLEPQDLLDRMDARLLEAFSTVEVLPGVLKLVKHLAAHNVPMAIATGSKQKNFAVKSANLPELFAPFGDRILCGDDPRLEGRGKPDPTIFLMAARLHLGIDDDEARSKVLVFEDGAPGVRAARAAGMQVVWIPDPELLETMGADHGLEPTHQHSTMEDFDPAAWGLPPY